MKIHGLQKMSLLDYPGHVACTVFLGGCDFRCPFCHNYELVDGSAEPVMEDVEFFAFLSKREGILDGVCITGGEPCLRADLAEFAGRIKEMGFKVKLDTNGAHPGRVKELIDLGLIDYVAMDIKNSPQKYAETIGLSSNRPGVIDAGRDNSVLDFDNIRQTIALLMEDRVDYEFRTTVVEQYHKKEDFVAIGQLIEGAKKYFLQQFVARNTVPDCTLEAPNRETIEKYIEVVRRYVPNAEVRGI